MFSADDLNLFNRRVLPAAIDIFRSYQIWGEITDVSVKSGDESLATIVDREVERFIVESIQKHFPGTRIVAEEGSQVGGKGSGYLFIDPVDGTREMYNQTSLSVIIIGVMQAHPDGDIVVGCTTAEPSTKRIWTAYDGKGCLMYHCNDGFQLVKECHVWQGNLDRQSTVFVDSSQGYRSTRRNRQMFTDAENAEFYRLLNSQTHVRVVGPNGQIQALLANGGQGVVGAVTLACGWPWDVCGVRLVLEAGGSARAFLIGDNELIEKDPTRVKDYDILVAGNSPETVDTIVESVTKAKDMPIVALR